MELIARLQGQLDREVSRTQRTLERVPEGHDDWKPHERSMPLGQLVGMVATMPSWLALIVGQDALDLAPETPRERPVPMHTRAEWLDALSRGAEQARSAMAGTTEEFLETPWALQERGVNVSVLPRGVMIADTLSHLAHHRGQLTVYLRLLGGTVPAVYGPSADDHRFD